MNKQKLKIFGWMFVAIIFILVVVATWKNKGIIGNNRDLRLGALTDNGLVMVNISPLRRTINVLEVSPDREVWVPGGFGWYRSDRIRKLLESQKREDIVAQLFLLNYGFVPVETFNRDSWGGELGNRELIRYWGIRGWLNYLFNNGNWLFRKEELSRNDLDEELDEIMQRDMSESTYVEMTGDVMVFNVSSINGLGNFVASAIQRAGLNVVNVQNSKEIIEKECLIRGSSESDNEVMQILKDLFPECQSEINDLVRQQEVELYFGQSWAEMINYQSYVRSF